jgi:flavoprotein
MNSKQRPRLAWALTGSGHCLKEPLQIARTRRHVAIERRISERAG